MGNYWSDFWPISMLGLVIDPGKLTCHVIKMLIFRPEVCINILYDPQSVHWLQTSSHKVLFFLRTNTGIKPITLWLLVKCQILCPLLISGYMQKAGHVPCAMQKAGHIRVCLHDTALNFNLERKKSGTMFTWKYFQNELVLEQSLKHI